MRRIVGILIAIFLAATLPGSVAAAQNAPRVVVIVGPAEGLTDLYRSVGVAAAREARRWTSDVVSVFSPDATWPVVKRALRGASVVIYLGHGNGWPSPYRNAPYPKTQNGLGLNPVAGSGDGSHQYFGESFLAREVRLAPGAVVLLHHLCYASGNSEPGLPEGSLEVGQQRVDNYAAGWLQAGAGAVIADTFGAPEPYLRDLFGKSSSIDDIWRRATTFHGHELDFASVRSPGYQAAMDPTRTDSGFNRSMVWRPGLTAAEMRAGAGLVAKGSIGPVRQIEPSIDSLASLGVTFRAPSLVPVGPASGLVAGTRATLSLPVKAPKGVVLPAKLQLGARWDPVLLEPQPTQPAAGPGLAPTGPPPTADPGTAPPAPDPSATPSPSPRGRPGPSPSPAITDPAASQPPAIVPVAAEVPGSLVNPTAAKLVARKLRIGVVLPAVPGTYRLVITVHRSDGVAFDAPTQALVSALTVRVSRPLSVAYGVVPSMTVVAGSNVALPVRVANDGALAWARPADPSELSEDLIDPSVARAHPSARLVARWVPLAPVDPAPSELQTASGRAQPDPGSELTVVLGLTAPTSPGPYLIVLDIASPLHGSLAATGVAPGQVRVVVVPAQAGPGASPAAP
jgi:hypothetical protein